MNAQKLFGKRIKELRKKKNLTQESLAELLGVFQKQIGNIETGATFTTMNNLEKLAEIFEVNIQDLFNFNYLDSREKILKDIHNVLETVSDDKLRLIYRLIIDITK